MQHNRFGTPALAAAFTGTAAAIAVLFCTSLQTAKQVSAADNPQTYKALFAEKCSACHNLPDPTVTQYTKDQWRGVVNRMLTKHQASDSIAPTEAAEIVDYLGLFPPKTTPGSNNPLGIKASDVWTVEPSQSFVFTFSSPDQLKPFHAQRGEWTVPTSSGTTRPTLTQAQPMPAGDDVATLLDTRDTVTGSMDMQTQFKITPGAAQQTIGMIVDLSDAKNFFVVRFDEAKSELAIVECKNGAFSALATAPTGDLASSPEGWHSLRAAYHADTGTLTVWTDANKKAITPLTDWTDKGRFGLATIGATTAQFRNMTVDIYPK